MTITYALSGLSPLGGHWKVHHEVVKANGKKAVSIKIEGAILDLTTRKPVLPEPELFKIFNLIQRTADFEVLGESRWIKNLITTPTCNTGASQHLINQNQQNDGGGVLFFLRG